MEEGNVSTEKLKENTKKNLRHEGRKTQKYTEMK